jgi:hypothetical protein
MKKLPKTIVVKIIQWFDLFGVPVSLLMKKKQSYHTVYGFIISLFIFTITFMSFTSLLIDMVALSNPTVLSSIK